MTPLTLASTDQRRPAGAAWLLALVLVGVPLAGCLGDNGGGDDGSLEGMRVFLAALGDAGGPASAHVGSVGIQLNGSATTQAFTLQTERFDLSDLSDTGQALLAAVGPGVEGEAALTVVVFDYLDLGGDNLTNARLEVPFDYPAGEHIEVTLTLDLTASAEAGAPRLANLVADRGQERVASVTGAELDLGEREEVPPLPTPTISAEAAEGNDTFPSFHVNDPIRFSFELPGASPDVVREVFWSFSDGTTTTGLEVEHTFRQPGAATASVVVEGTRGQQARANTTLDVYFTMEGEGNIGVGTGGAGVVDGRDVKREPLDLPGPFTSVSVRVEQSPSGNLCEGALGCAPSNVHVELLDPEDTVLGEDTTSNKVKFVNVTEALPAGEYTLRVKGDQGAAVGYKFFVEVHFLEGAGPASSDDGEEA